jgi:uncharacterized C2H2 Zn-finger protein
MHICTNCGYKTNRKSNFDYHNGRKFKCKAVLKHKTSDGENIANISVQEENGANTEETDDNVKLCEEKEIKCLDCSKLFVNKSGLKYHKCTGVGPLQCPTCFAHFNDRKGKSRHVHKCRSIVKSLKEDKLKAYNENEKLTTENKILKQCELRDGGIGNVVGNTPSEGDLKLKDADNNMVKIENDMLKKDIENRRLKNINEALKKELETLSNKTKPKRGFVNQVTRNKIAASQKWCCRLCDIILPGVFHIDHTIPLRYGGGDILENVSALCIQCHAEKTQTDLELYDIK